MLRMIRGNRFTATELAAKLGLSREQFDDRLALMERQGFLQLEKTCCAGQGGCARCCCSSRDRQEIAVAGYVLSEKGRRIAEYAS
jgi:predicted transcriptional regulator